MRSIYHYSTTVCLVLQEKQSRLKLEGAVKELQSENEQLKSTRSKANDLLQGFASVVYKDFDVIPKVNSQESLLDSRSQKSYHSISNVSRISRQSIRSNSSCSSMSSEGSSDLLHR